MPTTGATPAPGASSSGPAGTSASAAPIVSAAPPASPFDGLAGGYDETFTHGLVGRLLRGPLQRRLLESFAPGERVLELGCGTGEDAVHLGRHGVRVLATDAAPGMVAAARRKVAAADLLDLVEVRQLAFEELSQLGGPGTPATTRHGLASVGAERRPGPGLAVPPAGGAAQQAIPPLLAAAPPPPAGPPFDGAFSSFGAINCVRDPRGPARDLAGLVRPGARVLLCVMGPFVPWEWGWFLLHGRPAKACRRLRPGGAAWRGMTIRYPTIGAMKRAFAPAFRARRVAALGALLPPPYAEPWAARHPRLLARLDRWERRWETLPPLPWLADHYLLELERR